jgi:hypothetical protein
LPRRGTAAAGAGSSRWSGGGPDEIFKGALFPKFLSRPTGIWEDPVTWSKNWAFCLFKCKYIQRVLVREHEMELARQYHRRQCRWLHLADIVGEYSAKTEEKLIAWPPEFP